MFSNGGVLIKYNVGSIVDAYLASQKRLILIYGPTASGKSDLAVALANSLNADLINCDSVAIYKYFDIGTAKIIPPANIKIHLMDHVDPHEEYDAGRYAKEAGEIIRHPSLSSKPLIIVGGTGLYLRALFADSFSHELPKSDAMRQLLKTRDSSKLYAILKHFDPNRASELHPNDRYRIERAIEIRWLSKAPVRKDKPQSVGGFKIFMNPPRSTLDERIYQRSHKMIQAGLIEETQDLIKRGYADTKPMKAIGYAETYAYLCGEITSTELTSTLYTHTRQYAKRQVNWFRKLEHNLVLD